MCCKLKNSLDPDLQDDDIGRFLDGGEVAGLEIGSGFAGGHQIAGLREEIGLNYLMCAPLSRETFRLLADQVVPRL